MEVGDEPDETLQVSRFSGRFEHLVIVPGAALAIGGLALAQGHSVGKAVALALWLAVTLVVASIAFPRGYLFATPHLARRERRLASCLLLVLVVAGLAVAILNT